MRSHARPSQLTPGSTLGDNFSDGECDGCLPRAFQEEQRRNLIGLIPPALRPRVVLRWGNANELLVSGLLDGGDEIAQHAAVIDSPWERGHVVLFSLNPMWRGQTSGSYSLVFNTILNFDNLNAGRKLDEK